jgi:hypothetical protein
MEMYMAWHVDPVRQNSSTKGSWGEAAIDLAGEAAAGAAGMIPEAGAVVGTAVRIAVPCFLKSGTQKAQEKVDSAYDEFESASSKASALSGMLRHETREMPREERDAVAREIRDPMLKSLVDARSFYAEQASAGRVSPSVVREIENVTQRFCRETGTVNIHDVHTPQTHAAEAVDAIAEQHEKLTTLVEEKSQLEKKQSSWWPF